MCPATEAYPDVVELCALLQCLGFSVKSLKTRGNNMSQENGARTVTINCQASGLYVELESGSSKCSCLPEASQQDSGIWNETGIAGGQRLDKEYGCSIFGSLPTAHRERLTKNLRDTMRCIRLNNEIKANKFSGSGKANKSASMADVVRLTMAEAGIPNSYDLDLHKQTAKEDQQLPQEYGCSILGSRPTAYPECLPEDSEEDLGDMMRCVRQPVSMADVVRLTMAESGIPNSYDLDLHKQTAKEDQQLPQRRLLRQETYTLPGESVQDKPKKIPMLKDATQVLTGRPAYEENEKKGKKKGILRKQCTYTLSPGSVKMLHQKPGLPQPKARPNLSGAKKKI